MLLRDSVVYEQILLYEKIRISDGYEALNWSEFTIYVMLSFLSVNRLVIHIEGRLRVSQINKLEIYSSLLILRFSLCSF